jgi:uncharacterized DUF497 family protein
MDQTIVLHAYHFLCYSPASRVPTSGEWALRLDELLWDAWNEEHVLQHGVDPGEVEEAVFDPASLVFRTRGRVQARYIILGITDAGRYLFVVLEPQAGNRGYVITARDMDDGERRRFKARGK